jgi:predicted RNase H-like HicB family nuclease
VREQLAYEIARRYRLLVFPYHKRLACEAGVRADALGMVRASAETPLWRVFWPRRYRTNRLFVGWRDTNLVAMPLRIEIDREADGRWIADVVDLPGVMVYGMNKAAAIGKAKTLARRVIAERREHGEPAPEPIFQIDE